MLNIIFNIYIHVSAQCAFNVYVKHVFIMYIIYSINAFFSESLIYFIYSEHMLSIYSTYT